MVWLLGCGNGCWVCALECDLFGGFGVVCGVLVSGVGV